MIQKFNLAALLPEHIRNIKPYSSARDEFSGTASIFIDANENSFGSVGTLHRNRYPDPHQHELKKAFSIYKSIDSSSVFFGNGSDEVIDLIFRAFCIQGKDKVILLPPTYGMYEVSANINNIQIIKVLLTENFDLDSEKVCKTIKLGYLLSSLIQLGLSEKSA